MKTSAPSFYDAIIIGAGGAGLMCAAQAAQRGRRVLVVDHAEKIGQKILISGGGRCNFTNLEAAADRYISQNPHFCKSAFSQFGPQDFISLVQKHGIAFHEKKLGQQFCDGSAQQIVDMLLAECADAPEPVAFKLGTAVTDVVQTEAGFRVETAHGAVSCTSLVIATGGLSIPKLGATPFGYKIAEQFGLRIVPPQAALVPFTLTPQDLAFYDGLSGISFDAVVSCGNMRFRENVLMTHRGVSGPAILQISSYWQPGETIYIRLLPDLDWTVFLQDKRSQTPKQELKNTLGEVLPKRFVQRLIERQKITNSPLGQLSDKSIFKLAELFTKFPLKPNGTEGYRKAEVTRGGVDTRDLQSRTLESRSVTGLFFIGEVVDVTGWLGGYNFQWAWSSGFAAGQVA